MVERVQSSAEAMPRRARIALRGLMGRPAGTTTAAPSTDRACHAAPSWIPDLSGARGVLLGVTPAAPAPYRLVRPPAPRSAPLVPDAAQQRVLSHPGGPLLVLAGPGTGKTATIVELVARRVAAGLPAEQALVLTFSRKAAEELRERLALRLAVTTQAPVAWTFHSWSFALLRAEQHQVPGVEPLRLLSAAEQDVVLRELLAGSVDPPRVDWPPLLRRALHTRGLADEVRDLLSRAQERGLTPPQLAAVGAAAQRGDWQAVAVLAEDYDDVLRRLPALDYGGLITAAVDLAHDPGVQARLRARHSLVVVDEVQDTDPQQMRLLAALAGGGGDLVVVGDPDQAIYGFRGADVTGILRFPEQFRHRDGRPADVVALQRCRRCGPAVLAAAARVAAALPLPGLATERLAHHRVLEAAGPAQATVEAMTFPAASAEAEAIADLLRREHLQRSTPWSAMAVLVRSGVRSIPLLRRVLTARGVPVEVASDDTPLAAEPAVAPLLLALRCAADPEALTVEAAGLLLSGPLVAADAAALRRLARALRVRDGDTVAAAGEPHRLPRPSALLLREAIEEPALLVGVGEDLAWPVRRLAQLLARAREALREGPETALWQLWSSSRWSRRLVAASDAGGPAGRDADRDLDAVLALFGAIERGSTRRRGVAGVLPLLEEIAAQQLPAGPAEEVGTPGRGVRLLTAHRSKGLEWDVVVVASVQEGAWPDLRRRGSLLEADRLGTAGEEPVLASSQLLAEERRLFYVALTRARRRLVVTAVDSPEEEGTRPSRLLAELGVTIREVPSSGASEPLTLPAVVARLRRLAADPDSSAALRAAAAARLARLQEARSHDGQQLAGAADPASWWGLAEQTPGKTPIITAGEPVRLSGSALSALASCPLRWFLERQAHAELARSTALGFGSVVHALAKEAAESSTVVTLEALDRRLDRVWGSMGFEAPWQSVQQRGRAQAALRRFLTWHGEERGRLLHGVEVPFEVDVAVGEVTVRLRGTFDRVELDADGAAVVVDLKTASSAPTRERVRVDPQLGTYQLAVRAGALGSPATAAGAELVQLRDSASADHPKVQRQEPLPEGDATWVHAALAEAVGRLQAEDFPPAPGGHCARCPFRVVCPAQPEGRQVVA